jgi:hypothetical protein
MKTLLLLLITTVSFGQNLSLTGNITLPLQGGNCGNGPTTEVVYQDINLNGYTITLRSVNLSATANLNGPGSIISCGNQNNSTVCVSGAIQNNPNLNGLSCAVLSQLIFELIPENYGKNYKVVNFLGQVVSVGIVHEGIFQELPKHTNLILKVEGFEGKKLNLRQ